MKSTKEILLLLASAVAALICSHAFAQGCVAAHSNQRPMGELVNFNEGNVNTSAGSNKLGFSLHNLTVDIGYRVFNSNKYFQGTKEISRLNAVENHQNIFDVGLAYQLTPRWSVIADVPVYNGTRNQIYPPVGIFQVSGLGDISIGAQSWIFRTPTEGGGNVAVSMALKIPTGIDNARGSALYQGQIVKATADQSLQPGDGGWGFIVGSQAFKALWRGSNLYGQGQYLFNPQETNGVATFRSQPGQGVMSVTDQYLYRTGLSQTVPKAHGFAVSMGIRGEGVPVRDLLGDSNGFRRPGAIVSIDPGILLNLRRTMLSVNGPWAVYRNRPPSLPEIQYHVTNGDAFFADYTVVAILSRSF